jgi:hypothetical protein
MPCTAWALAGRTGAAPRRRQGKPTQCLTPIVGNELHGSRQVERAEVRLGGNVQAHVAAVDVFVAHAKPLAAKQKGHAKWFCLKIINIFSIHRFI